MSLTISPELQSLIPPLTPEERAQLEANLLADGCRDPLIVWQQEQVLLDGHHRYEICERHGLTYTIQELSLPDMDAARLWMIQNQLGRRNLTPQQMSYYRGEQYNLQKQRHGGDRKSDISSTQNGNLILGDAVLPDGSPPHNEDVKTVDRLAAEHGVSRNTIARDGAYAAAVEILATALGPDARQAMLTGHLQIPKQDVPLLASLVEQSPETAIQVTAALAGATRGTDPGPVLRAIVTAARCEICHRPLSNPASVSRGIGPSCAGHSNGAHDAPVPLLVLEPEAQGADETPASTLTERQRARSGPRDEKVPGSVAWCWQTLDLLKIQWQRKDFDDRQFKETLAELRQQEVWTVVPPEAPYGSLEALLGAELGLDQQRLYDEALVPSRAGDILHEATAALEMLETYYRATPQLFELHEQGYLDLALACQRFAALVAPAAPPAPAPDDPDCPPFDTTIYILGKLCKAGHEWGSTGQTRLRINGRYCPLCNAATKREARRGGKSDTWRIS
jgi:Family of unknown function (DUF6011)